MKFANVVFEEGDYVYSDADGIIISKKPIIHNNESKGTNSSLPYNVLTYVKRMDNDWPTIRSKERKSIKEW